MRPNLLTEEQLALILSISPRTLQTQRQTGRGIPFIKIGKLVRYDLTAVEDFIQKNNYTSTYIQQFKYKQNMHSESLEKIHPG